jgi:hypothetical protein
VVCTCNTQPATEELRFVHTFAAPKPISRRIVIAAQPAVPVPDQSVAAAADPSTTYQNPPRFSYPQELLKHRFLPNGAEGVKHPAAHVDSDLRGIEVDTVKKAKKRKGDADEPRKPKKSKRFSQVERG